MKKNSTLYDDEIDLSALFKTIWDGKKKIFLITIISLLIGFGYNSQIPRNYLNSITINTNNNVEFIKLDNFRKLLELEQLEESKESNKLYLVKFINELKDYEEFLLSLKNSKKIQEDFSKLTIQDQEIELFKFARLLEIFPPKINEENYTINFTWHDPHEAKKILQDTLDLVSKNLKRLIDSEIMQSTELKKKMTLNIDRTRLNNLKEQAAIARELNIVDNQIDNVNLSQSSVSLNINTSDIAYYLRGYKAIEKEIELIEKRDYDNIKFIKQEADSLKNENIKWAVYNVYLMKTVSLKNTKFILTISILLGLIVGIYYVLNSSASKLKKISK